MKLDVGEKPGSDWGSLVAQCRGNIYHTGEWAEAARRNNNTPLFFTWLDPHGAPAAIAVGHLARSRIPLIGRWNGSLALASLPAIVPPMRGAATELLVGLKTFAGKAGCRTLDIESHMSEPCEIDAPALGASSSGRIEFRLDLSKPGEEIWAAFASHHRRKIRKAEKHEITVRNSTSIDEAANLRELQKGSRDRRLSMGLGMMLGDDGPVVGLVRELLTRGLGRLFFAESAGRLVSGALMSEYGGRAYYVFGGSSEEGFRLDAPGLLFWRMIHHYREAGFRELNLGGVPAAAAEESSDQHGLYRFKSGFGAQQVACADLNFDLRPALTGSLNRLSRWLRRD